MRFVWIGMMAVMLVADLMTFAHPVQAENSLRIRPSRDRSNPERSNPESVEPDRSAPSRPVSPSNSSPSRPSFPRIEDFKYRLVVQGNSENVLRQVRQVVPDAFRTLIEGQRVIQAGLFVDQSEAEAVQQQLDRLNLESEILSFDRTPTRSNSSNHQSGFQYRLVVQGSSDSLLRQVRQIIPDAFRTTIDGQRVIQAGLFVGQAEAEAIQRQLSRLDTPTHIFDVNYGVTAPAITTTPLRPPTRDGRVLVVVDPGHGGADPGAVGIGGIHESDIVLSIAQEVVALLDESGLQAVLTRQDDREIDLQPRVDLAESVHADLFVSIHANSINMSRPDVNGVETYYYDSGGSLASSIHNSLVNATGMEDRGIHQARFYVLTRTSMPAVLVEVGFVTGQEDAARLSNATMRNQIAQAIAQGILRYVR